MELYRLEPAKPKSFYPWVVKKLKAKRGFRAVFACDLETCLGYCNQQAKRGAQILLPLIRDCV